MKFTKAAACVIIALSAGAGAPYAQSLSSAAAQAPAEFPPSSFQGRQYVDSRGCVFIRAGAGGATSWVPRVTRTRELICGQKPSLAKPAVVQAAPAAKAPEPIQTAAVTTARPATKLAAAVEPSRNTVTRARVAAAEPVPTPVKVKRAVAPVAAAKPKAAAPKVVRVAPVAVAKATTGSGRIVPEHVYFDRLAERDLKVPKGYAPVWDDDRLNLRRAEQTREGYARTQLVWTSTVPRRLIDRSSGKDVTAKVPLVFPYTDFQTQSREYGKVALVKRDGKVMKRVQRKAPAKAEVKVKAAVKAKAAVKPSKTAARVKASGSKGRYIQVGAFGEPANAQAAAQRLQAAGLPARIGNVTRKGKTLQLVVAGPFANASSATEALRRAQARGFKDAFLRK